MNKEIFQLNHIHQSILMLFSKKIGFEYGDELEFNFTKEVVSFGLIIIS